MQLRGVRLLYSQPNSVTTKLGRDYVVLLMSDAIP